MIGVSLLVLGAPCFGLHQAKAAVSNPDFWFTETLIPGEITLPADVRILPSDPASQPRAFFVLENDTQTPLYVMALEYKDVLVMTTPDPYWKNRVNGAHEAASYTFVPNRQAKLGIEALADLDKGLKDYNVKSSDPPPQNQQTPPHKARSCCWYTASR